MADLIEHQIAAESGGDPYAKNPRSSAYGVGQVISSTWMDWVRRRRPDLMQGRSTAQVLGLRADPGITREFMADYNAENAATLQAAGFDATPGTLDLAYFAGPAGAKSVLGANPNTPVSQLLTPGAVAANPHIRNMNAAQLIAWTGRRGNKGGAVASPTPAARAVAQNAASTVGNDTMAQQADAGFLPQIDLGDLPSARKKMMADALMKDAFGSSGNIRSRGGVLARLAQLAAGSYMSGQHEDQVNERNRKMAQALMGANGNDQLIRTLFASGDPDLIKAGVSSKIRGAEDSGRGSLATTTLYNPETGDYEVGTVRGDGSFQKLKGADNLRVAPKATTKEVGGELITTDERGNVLRREKVDVSGNKSAEEQGKIAAAARAGLPGAKTSVENAFTVIEQLKKHPGREAGTGLSAYLDPRNYIPGTDAKNFAIKNRQAVAQSFMAAREGLKGAGQVTDFEGGKGQDAIAALDQAQSDDAYVAALGELEKMMRASYEDLQKKAELDKVSTQGNPAPAPLSGKGRGKYNPATGEIE